MRLRCVNLIVVMVALTWGAAVRAQQAPDATPGGSVTPRAAPGEHTPYESHRDGSPIGSRPGSLRPRGPRTRPQKSRPSGRLRRPCPEQPLGRFRARPLLVPNGWSILFEIEDEGPANGLTLDQAMQRVVHASIGLRAKSLEIPQAQADVLTAGMLANPVVYFDGQLIPYRPYNSVTNPGGPTQYDLNMAYPVDLSGKRQARVDVASAAQRVAEAVYQDAVRQEIDRLGNAYVDALAARLSVRTLKTGLARLDEIRQRNSQAKQDPQEAETLRRQMQIQRQTINLALIDAEASWKNSQRALAILLDIPSEKAPRLELRGTIDDDVDAMPNLGELVTSALANRPDLASYRLGVHRAVADVQLSKANRLPDVFVLYQPMTYQDNRPFQSPSSRSWAVGATVTVPLFDRNQGNIRKSQVNVEQSKLELRALEQRIVAEVENAYDEYLSTLQGIEQIEQELIPEAEKTRRESQEGFRAGKLDSAGYLSALRDLDDLGRQYRELLIRHRRGMLAINTAVGIRVFP